jgi:hydrogenase-4 component B
MDFAQTLFTIALALPLVAFVFALTFPRDSYRLVHAPLILGGLVGFAALGLHSQSGSTVEVAAFLRMGLAVHGFSPLFLALIYGGTVLTSLFAIEYVRRYADIYTPHWLNAATALFVFGMQATVLSTVVVGFLLAWEIMSIAAYFLVIADRKDESMRAGFLYLLMTHIGFLALTAGFLVLSNGDPWATWSDLSLAAHDLSPAYLAASFFLLFAGFGSKAGLVPLHQWLPYAHPQAPSHSSALLSGVMLKVALFGFLQSALLFPHIELWWAVVVIVIGTISAFFGVVHAAIENDMKRLLAWSSIENMGLLFAAAGAFFALTALTPVPIVLALAGSLTLFIWLHSINHMLFKTGLFLSAGSIGAMTHTRDLNLLGGLAQKWPLFSGVVILLALGAAALPPLATFFGEWIFVQTLASGIAILPQPFAIGAVLLLAAVGLVAGLAIFAFVSFFSNAFLGRARSEHAEHVGALPRLLVIPPALCAVGLVVAGLFIPLLRGLPLSEQELMLPGASISPSFIFALAILIAVLLSATVRLVRPRVRITETWDCGQPLTPRMQYTASGFSAPIRFFFRSIVVRNKRMIVEPVSAENPWIAHRRLEWSIDSVWEKWLYLPIGNAFMRGAMLVKRLQSGVVQIYLLLVIIALAATVLFSL